MKKFVCVLLLSLMLLGSMPVSAASVTVDGVTVEDADFYARFQGQGITLNIYNWGEYISDGSDDAPDVITVFEELTGIDVNYTNFGSNEEMYAKIKSGGAQYDIIVPSDYMIGRMIQEGMLEKLDMKNIPLYKNIAEEY
ncbi:MAG: extracellular solute-binding protein, partial [Oscillospiraceae bacterium]|nr:extracellular solute-binding protein [Oscillospiraceae bacterium]